MSCELLDRELNAWIAEHLMGWTQICFNESGAFYHGAHPNRPKFPWETIPVYSSALSLSRKAEEKIKKLEVQHDYIQNLASVLWPEDSEDSWFLYCFGLTTASARQRCEAMWATREEIEKEKVKRG